MTMPPPVLLDPDTGQRWVFVAETEEGATYAPQQAPMPLFTPAKPLPWETVTATVSGEGE